MANIPSKKNYLSKQEIQQFEGDKIESRAADLEEARRIVNGLSDDEIKELAQRLGMVPLTAKARKE